MSLSSFCQKVYRIELHKIWLMPNYPKIRECILHVLTEHPLTNREICDRVHALIPDALSPDTVRCPHTHWKQWEWEHEIRRAIYQLKKKGKITLDKNHLYQLV